MTSSPVGMRCPECARQTTKVRTIRAPTRRGYEVTIILIAINVIAFFAEGSGVLTLSGVTNNSWLLNHGDLFSGYISGQALAPVGISDSHEYWRLLTSGFLHLDILHIAFNMYVLYWVGRLLEPAIGRSRYLAIYFTGLLAGSLGAIIASPLNSTAGASGAIFGLMGAAFLLLIVINLVLSVSVVGISLGAHIGGLIGGGLATLAFHQADRVRSPVLGWVACGALAVISVAGAILIAHGTNFQVG
jgi:membrane associated rhomboid family serine protease